MIRLTVNRILENGAKVSVDIILRHINFVADFNSEASCLKEYTEKQKAILRKQTCVICFSNGVVMWIEYEKKNLLKLLDACD